jgi:hypothetical protein
MFRSTATRAFRATQSHPMGFRSQDAWRKHPLLHDLWKDPFPGLKPAIFAFGFYYVTEKTFPRFYQGMSDMVFGAEEHHHDDEEAAHGH